MSQPANSNLDWEKTVTYDVGLDASLLNDRLNLTVDYYYKRTNNMLFSSDLPAYTGYSKQDQNIADMQNQGIEVSLTSYNIRRKDFTWMTILNMSHNSNKILKLNFEGNQLDQANSSFKYYEVGGPVAQWYLHEWGGVNPENGNPVWILADGTKTEVPPASNYATSAANKKVYGTALPKFYGSLTNSFEYKGIELNFMFTFSCGGRMINATKATLYTYTTADANNLHKDRRNAWQMYGQKTDMPKLNNSSVIGNYDYTTAVTSSRFLEKSDYLRLRNLEVAYRVPQNKLRKLKVFNNIRASVIMTNLFTITSYSGVDPDVSAFGSSALASGYDYLTMPQTKSYQMSLLLGF